MGTVPQTEWVREAERTARVRERRLQAERAKVLGFMHDIEGLSYREIERRTGVPRSTVARLVTKFQRRRDAIEAQAPQGAVAWAEAQTCPKCGTEGMVLRMGRKGWFAGCWAFTEYRCLGTVSWAGATREPWPPGSGPRPV